MSSRLGRSVLSALFILQVVFAPLAFSPSPSASPVLAASPAHTARVPAARTPVHSHAARDHAKQSTRTPRDHRAAIRLALAHAPARLTQAETARITASLGHAVSDGRITFTLRDAGTSMTLATCRPVRGHCAIAWARGTAGTVTLAASWSGDRRYKPASSALTLTIYRARYSYSGVWQGARLRDLTRIEPAVALAQLHGATRAGQLRAFQSGDPAFRCLVGRAVPVYTAPRVYPDDVVALHGADHGAHCQAGAWLIPQGASITTLRPASARPGAVVAAHGSFPPARPDGATALYLVRNTLRGVAPVVAWGTHTVVLRVPTRLTTGRYAVRLRWYDRLTGLTVTSSAAPFRVTAPATALAPSTRVVTPSPTATTRTTA